MPGFSKNINWLETWPEDDEDQTLTEEELKMLLDSTVERVPNKVAEGERKLALAVLDEALRNVSRRPVSGQKGRDIQSVLRADAMAWIMSRDTSYIFSFESICDIIGWSPEAIRERVQQNKVDIAILSKRITQVKNNQQIGPRK